MIRVASPAAAAAFALAAACSGPAAPQPSATSTQVSATSGCDLMFDNPVTLSNAGGERLVVTIEGPSCTEAAVLWRLYDSAGVLVWSDVSQFADNTLPDNPVYAPASREEVAEMYGAKATPAWNEYRTGDLPEWDPACPDMDNPDWGDFSFDHMDGGTSAEATIHYGEDWERLRRADLPIMCLVPGTHYADCYVLTPGTGVELVYNVFW